MKYKDEKANFLTNRDLYFIYDMGCMCQYKKKEHISSHIV